MFLSCLKYAFQSESTLYSCRNVKELLARSRRQIWSLSDCNWTRTQNHLVCKQTLNHLNVHLRTKWFWVRVQLQPLSSMAVFMVFLQNSSLLVWSVSSVLSIKIIGQSSKKQCAHEKRNLLTNVPADIQILFLLFCCYPYSCSCEMYWE